MLRYGVIAVLLTQLSAPPGNRLPQIMTADFKAAPVRAGQKTDLTVSFKVTPGYLINHTPPISLKLTSIAGIKLEKTELTSPSKDPKSKDEYYVDLPTLKVSVSAAKSGKYEIPGKLTYFFCSKADGFCSKQDFDVRIPLLVQ